MLKLLKLTIFLVTCCLSSSIKAQVNASFTYNVPPDCAPVPVQFTDVSSGNIISWKWTFGNGDTSSLQNPVYTFPYGGTYKVTLIVNDGINKDNASQTVTVNGSTKADFTYTYNDACQVPATFKFTPATIQNSVDYHWDFDDGNKSIVFTPSNTFSQAGTYNVKLVTISPTGCMDSTIQPVSIGAGQADFLTPASACKNEVVTFENTSNPAPRSTRWEVNGITVSKSLDLNYVFANTGTYIVKLTSNFGPSCDNTVTKQIIVSDKPVADFTESGTLTSCIYPQKISFTSTAQNATSFKWLFGDGDSAKQANITHTYSTAGSFSVSLIVFNSNGCSDTITKTALVRLGPPVITGFSSLPKAGCVPVVIQTSAIMQSADPVVSYDWDFGDGTAHSTNAAPSHTYSDEGYYTVNLTVQTANGCTGSYSLFQAVSAGTPVIPEFTSNDTISCASAFVQFKNLSQGNVTSWNWDFGDGTKGSGPNPTHQYKKIGYSDVILYISNKGCNAQKLVKPKFIYSRPPVSRFTVYYTCTDQLDVQFKDSSIAPQSWLWDFGDNTAPSTQQNPPHVYTATGQYNVKLTTTNDSANVKCTSTDSLIVTVVDVKPSITYEPEDGIVCKYDSLTMITSNPSYIADYLWDLGDNTQVFTDTILRYAYKRSGMYKPSLIARYLNGCYDTIYSALPVTVYGPLAGFTTKAQGVCLPVTVTFTDTSKTDGFHNISSRIWSYGDLNSDTLATLTHNYTYTTAGNYKPKLIITDEYGCTDTLQNTKPIKVSDVNPNFTYIVSAACDSATVQFTNTTQVGNDEIKIYTWNFDNTGTINTVSPSYRYYDTGTYKVSLVAVTGNGCIDSSVQQLSVNVAKSPRISLNAPDDACALAASAFDAVQKDGKATVTSWQWNFGDGITDANQTTQHTYSNAGDYTVNVIATADASCADTATHLIHIHPLPLTDAGVDTFVCIGNSINLSATGADSYTWKSAGTPLSCMNCPAPTSTPAQPTWYYVTGDNVYGCTTDDSVFIDVQQHNPVTVTANSTQLCAGNSIQLTASGTDVYNWQPASGLSDAAIANPVATPVTTTTYTLTATDKRQCFTDNPQITITVFPKPEFNIIDSLLVLNKGEVRTLATTSAPNTNSWFWQPATGLSCNTCEQPVLTAAISTTYQAIAYTDKGCSDTDKIRVEVLCDQNKLVVPAAFTPNSDGTNDRFFPLSSVDVKVRSFIIYNRAGQVIFSRSNTTTNNYNDGWDGTYQSNKLPPDTYVYRIEVVCNNQSIPLRGTVVLIR